MTSWYLTALLAALTSSSAMAQECQKHIDATSKASPERLGAAFQSLVQCNGPTAEAAFPELIQQRESTDQKVTLALAAIDAKAYTPVWSMLDAVQDYGQRDAIAKAVGASCAKHPDVTTFLQGAYFGLRNTQFGKWAPAVQACDSDTLSTWLKVTASKPPASSYDEKYNTILTALVVRERGDALPVLKRAAVEAANNEGPFNAIIEKMKDAVTPDELGAEISAEDRRALETELVSIANAVAPAQAALVADRLYNAGAVQAAASLLPRVYPDRVQHDGSLLYGVAAIESCENRAYIHFTKVVEPAKRWSIMNDVSAPIRGSKQRLKCDTEGEWPVLATNEPAKNEDEIHDWVQELNKQWESKGFVVKLREEKALILD